MKTLPPPTLIALLCCALSTTSVCAQTPMLSSNTSKLAAPVLAPVIVAPVVKTEPAPVAPVAPKVLAPALAPTAKLAPVLEPSSAPVLKPLALPAGGLTDRAAKTLPPPATDAPGVATAPGLQKPLDGKLERSLDQPDGLAGARINPADLKQDMNLKELSAQNKGGGLAGVRAKMMGVGLTGKNPGKAGILGEGKKVGSGAGEAISDAVGEQGPITGSKYGDTFGGSRINNKQSGGKGNFAGSGKGKASQGGPDESEGGAPAGTIASMLTAEGGKPTGDTTADAKELAYAQSVGTDGYAATKNMTQEERKSYWEGEKNKQMVGASRPREDDMGSGSGVPMGRQDIVTQGRGLAGKTGGAGGADDGRTDQQSGGGSTGGMIAQGLAGAPEREVGVGTLNMDAVLKINQVARPVENQ